MDIKSLEKIFELFNHSQATEFEYQSEDFKVKFKKESEFNQLPIREIKPSLPIEILNSNSNLWVKAPLVGTFYVKANPDSNPYISVGQSIKKGQVICLIEAMKVMNEIKADRSGIVKEIKAINGKMVEFNQDMVLIEDEL